jgi:uncharacterized protein (DUF433 family)
LVKETRHDKARSTGDPGTKTENKFEGKIIKTGRGPEIAGTRMTVYDVIEYYKTGWHRDMIAAILSLSSQQVEAAIRYIEENHDEVMASYEKNMERIRRGNPPELQEKLDAGHERFLAKVKELHESKSREAQNAGRSGGH